MGRQRPGQPGRLRRARRRDSAASGRRGPSEVRRRRGGMGFGAYLVM